MKTVIAFLFFSLIYPHQSFAFDPAINWRSIQTEHFEVIYADGQQNLAKKYAEYAELSYQKLSNYFKELPPHTSILINDSVDLSNGSATSLPYSAILVQPSLPTPNSGLNEYGNWGYELVAHEFTHSTNFVPTHGFYTPLKYIFGNIIRPNSVLPRWFLEGLAVEMETRLSQHGRLRSTQTDAQLRALSLEDKLLDEDLSRINEVAIPSWPFGTRPYLIGSQLLARLMQKHGEDLPNYLIQKYATRLPFLLNAPLEKKAQTKYQESLMELYTDIDQRSDQQEHLVKKTQNNLKRESFFTGHSDPKFSPDGKLLITARRIAEQGTFYYIHERKKDNYFTHRKKLFPARASLRVSWLPDSSGFIYDQIGPAGRFNNYYDLYHYDLKTSKINKLTEGLRLHQPHLSPDGNNVAAIQNFPGGTSLGVYNLKSKTWKTLFKPKVLQVRVSNPTFVDDHTIVFSYRNLKGKESLLRYNLKSQKLLKTAVDLTNIRNIKKSGDKLIVSSFDSGTDNLYLVDLTLTHSFPITNTTTGVINGDIDPVTNQLFHSELTAGGYQIFVSDYKKTNPPKLSPLMDYAWPEPPAASIKRSFIQKEDEYSPWKYLIPTYWIPFLFPIEDGYLVQAQTQGGDPTGTHSYLLNGSFDTVTSRLNYAVSYLNKSTPIDLGFSYSSFNESNQANRDQIFQYNFLTFNSQFFIPYLSNNWRAGLNWNIFTAERAINATQNENVDRAGPKASIRYSNFADTDYETKFQLLMSLENYMITSDNLKEYSRFFARSSLFQPLCGRTALNVSLQAASSNLEDDRARFLGERTLSGNFLAGINRSSFLLRGYPSGNFYGTSMYGANIEFQTPFVDIFKGKDLFPVFFKRVDLHIFVDAIALEGNYISDLGVDVEGEKFDTIFTSVGAEFHLNMTLGYNLPAKFILGLHYGLDEEANGGLLPFFAFGLEGLNF